MERFLGWRNCIHRRETIQENESIKAHQGSYTAISDGEGALFYASMSIVTPDLKSMIQ